jgi:acetolactate synthase-1/2/3 large subunit
MLSREAGILKGNELIAPVPGAAGRALVFGMGGHGNVGMLNALYNVRDNVIPVSPRRESNASQM